MPPSREGTPVYRAVRAAARAFFRAWFRLSVSGVERAPRSGPLLVAANHASYLDPLVLGAIFPRPIRFLMIRTYYDPWYLKWFCAPMGAIPLPHDVSSKAGAVKSVLRSLEKGNVVGIFPEGRRSESGELLAFERGIEVLASRGNAPVLPAYIHGARRAMPVGRAFPLPFKIHVSLGEILFPHEERMTERLEERLRQMSKTEESHRSLRSRRNS